MRANPRASALVVMVVASAVGCAHMTPESARDVRIGTAARGGPVTQAELQQDVQRIASVFMDRVAQAADPLVEVARAPQHKEALLQRVLLYNSSALDIATGPFPELNLLDMLVFTDLCRWALEEHWIPERIGPAGQPMVDAFKLAEEDLWEVADRIIDRQKHADVEELIATWKREHPNQYRVEGVRFREFSEHAGSVASERRSKTRGVLGQMRSATQAADQALLISERALFLAHRMPFLLRLQVRIGVQETMTDSWSRLENVEALMKQVPAMRPLIAELAQLATTSEKSLREGRLLMADVEPYLRSALQPKSTAQDGEIERVAGVAGLLDSANTLADRSLTLVRELRSTVPADPEKTFAAVQQLLDATARRWMLYLLAVGLGWAVFFWSGYFVVKRLL